MIQESYDGKISNVKHRQRTSLSRFLNKSQWECEAISTHPSIVHPYHISIIVHRALGNLSMCLLMIRSASRLNLHHRPVISFKDADGTFRTSLNGKSMGIDLSRLFFLVMESSFLIN